jgi:hypothetical protein
VVIRAKKQKQCLAAELQGGECWIAMSLADSSGLILAARVGKHTDELILVVSYFNWISQHSRLKTTTAQRAGLTDHRWSGQDILSFPTLI